MKNKFMLLAVLLIICKVNFAQLNFASDELNKNTEIKPYPINMDSTYRFHFECWSKDIGLLEKYIGQKIYVYPNKIAYKPNKKAYRRVYSDYLSDNFFLLIDFGSNNDNSFQSKFPKSYSNSEAWFVSLLSSNSDTIFVIFSGKDAVNFNYKNDKGKIKSFTITDVQNVAKYVNNPVKFDKIKNTEWFNSYYYFTTFQKGEYFNEQIPIENGEYYEITDVALNDSDKFTDFFGKDYEYTSKNRSYSSHDLTGNDWYLKLESKGNEIFLVFDCYTDFENRTKLRPDYPFILVGFFEKSKELYVGKTFYSIKTKSDYYEYSTDTIKWICKDVVIKENSPLLVFENEEKEVALVHYARYLGRSNDRTYNGTERLAKKYFQAQLNGIKPDNQGNYIYELFTEKTYKQSSGFNYYYSESEMLDLINKKNESAKQEQEEKKIEIKKLSSKYGNYYGKLVANNKLVIGMTKEMCIDALGKPSNVNSIESNSTIIEIWDYYDLITVSFVNNKISLIEKSSL